MAGKGGPATCARTWARRESGRACPACVPVCPACAAAACTLVGLAVALAPKARSSGVPTPDNSTGHPTPGPREPPAPWQSGLQGQPGAPCPQVPGLQQPLPAPCLALNDTHPWSSPSLAWARPAHRDGTAEPTEPVAEQPPPAHGRDDGLPGPGLPYWPRPLVP